MRSVSRTKRPGRWSSSRESTSVANATASSSRIRRPRAATSALRPAPTDRRSPIWEVRTAPHGDAFGHGTAVAGIIHSLAPEAFSDQREGARRRPRGQGRRLPPWPRMGGFPGVRRHQPLAGPNRREWALAFYEVCDEAYFRNCTWPRTHSGSIGTLTRRRSFWPAGSTSTCRGPPGPVTPAPPG